MKTKSPPFKGFRVSLSDPDNVFEHILSPLELSALRNEYKEFTYKFGDIPLLINRLVCKELHDSSLFKLQLFTSIVRKASQEITNDAPGLSLSKFIH